MASTLDFAEYVRDQISSSGDVTFHKMFGEYMIYVNSVPLLLVCDNTVYVKKIPQVEDLMRHSSKGIPYPNAKEHYILDIDDKDLSLETVQILMLHTMIKPKKKRKSSLN